MSDNSARLALPYIHPAQAQKHVTHNEAVDQLDLLVQMTVEAVDALTPPATPAEGEAFALGTGASGDWLNQDGMIAVFSGGGWQFVAPQTGWRLFAKDIGELRIWDSAAWVALPQAVDNLPGIGIGTSHDAINRLAVAGEATLLTHGGNGHQLKLNKADVADTGTVLFQTNFSGRAEIGLAGEDDFSFKTSADGSNWTTDLRINAADGTVTLTKPSAPSGIHIGGTAAENHLSAYSTGVFTPNAMDQSGNSVSTSPVAVDWVRIGAQATVYFGLIANIDTTGLVATDALAFDLPVTASAASFGFVELSGPVACPGPYQWSVPTGTAQARIRCVSTGADLTVGDITSGSTGIVGGTLNVFVG